MLTIAVRLQNALPGRTTRAEPLTNSWSGVGDGEKTASGKRCGGAGRRGKPDAGREPETRKQRKQGRLRSWERRGTLTGGRGRSRGKGLAPQVKQRASGKTKIAFKRLIINDLCKPQPLARPPQSVLHSLGVLRDHGQPVGQRPVSSGPVSQLRSVAGRNPNLAANAAWLSHSFRRRSRTPAVGASTGVPRTVTLSLLPNPRSSADWRRSGCPHSISVQAGSRLLHFGILHLVMPSRAIAESTRALA
jgi:hypothetical protein